MNFNILFRMFPDSRSIGRIEIFCTEQICFSVSEPNNPKISTLFDSHGFVNREHVDAFHVLPGRWQ
jgi:hypothetical protein